jgi:two-component sensor histidine kinase
MVLDISERKAREEHAQLLMREVNHRAKNMLALIQAVARRTVASGPEDFLERLDRRISSMAANQDLLVQGDWKAIPISSLLRAQLAPLGDSVGKRVLQDGPAVELTAAAAQSIGMALHELATNAMKYGALSREAGRVSVRWDIEVDSGHGPVFTLEWVESGGPVVTQPRQRGFGSTVITQMVKAGLGCEPHLDFAPTGLIWRIACPAELVLEGGAKRIDAAVTDVRADEAIDGLRVLLVEDDPLIALDLAQLLEEAGFVVIGPAHSVAGALGLLRDARCDAAVLDVNLGAETAEPIALALAKTGTPFVTLSGYSRDQQPAAMRNAPLLGKPVIPETLFAELNRCRKQTARPNN